MTKKRPTEEAYSELQYAYDFYNKALFDGQLPSCLITLQRQKRTFGYFSRHRFVHRDSRRTDEIAMNPAYFAVVPLIEVLQTLAHEMTHLWQEHFGKPGRTCYHNVQWANKMESIGLMPSSTGQPGGKRIGQSMADYMIAGGSFERATKKLLGSGFAISWFDSFPAEPPPRFATPHLNVDPVQPGIDEPYLDEDTAFAMACTPPAMLQPGLIEGIGLGNRSNRSKYTCPTCGINLWGKPGLRVICDSHKVLLAEDAD